MRMFKTVIIGCVMMLGLTSMVNAQAKMKFGHIDSNTLLLAMPERAAAEATIQEEAKKLDAQLKAMTAEYQNKLGEYQTEAATMTDLIRQTKEKEINDLGQRIQTFQAQAEESLATREQELLEPMIKKAKDAITEVSKENGFTYVFDSSVGVLLYMPEADDIMPLVKKKLAIQ